MVVYLGVTGLTILLLALYGVVHRTLLLILVFVIMLTVYTTLKMVCGVWALGAYLRTRIVRTLHRVC